MDFLKYTSNIKAGLFLLGFFLIIFLLSYTQSIVNELRNDNGEIVKLYAEIIAETISDEKDMFDHSVSAVKQLNEVASKFEAS